MVTRLIAAISLFICLISICFGLAFCLPDKVPVKEAYYYQKLDNKKVQCFLCPRKCLIPDGKRGFCNVRENRGGTLYSLVYAKPAAIHVDPIEKKPLFHFLPGSSAFSIATVGCNLRCKFCQNWQISQCPPEEAQTQELSPQDLVKQVKASGIPVIAYTYTEPTIFYEYMFDTAKLAKQAGIKNVMHSAGFINEKPLRELCPYLDAANIDLKGFTQEYYNDVTLGKLEDVLRTLKILKEEGVWLEITNLILPGLNDSPEKIKEMCVWVKDNLGDNVPLHFSRFWPMYKLVNLSPTPVETLKTAYNIAKEAGLKYVYIGNVQQDEGEATLCPKCGKLLVRRIGYSVLENVLLDGKCPSCGEKIAGVWK